LTRRPEAGAGTVGNVSPRLRLYAIVAVAAVGAAGLTVGITLATRTTPPKRAAAPKGVPPLVVDLGVRTDSEAVALRRAAGLYESGKLSSAARIFDRYRSVEAQVGAALARWPDGFLALSELAGTRPRSSLVQLEYGVALYWRGAQTEAKAAWRSALAAQPDTPYAVRAEDLLYPDFPRGLPEFVPSFPAPEGLASLSPPRQFAELARRAKGRGARDKLLYGVALQRLGRQRSALREFERAAELAPGEPEPKVAVAVARFDKAQPARTFSRLGPLSSRYPKSQSVRFHLGLCLLWLGSVDKAKEELRLARSLGARTPLGRQAQAFLSRLKKIRTS
jgi:tetratricopeptide (TPR) repeat protein